ncbi:hypothetical protein [Leeia sp.]|uniref:hypothetical protein n=1 Tax=Leeia sp. TaxID=2884678 RepID=UPI0035B4B3F5
MVLGWQVLAGLVSMAALLLTVGMLLAGLWRLQQHALHRIGYGLRLLALALLWTLLMAAISAVCALPWMALYLGEPAIVLPLNPYLQLALVMVVYISSVALCLHGVLKLFKRAGWVPEPAVSHPPDVGA